MRDYQSLNYASPFECERNILELEAWFFFLDGTVSRPLAQRLFASRRMSRSESRVESEAIKTFKVSAVSFGQTKHLVESLQVSSIRLDNSSLPLTSVVRSSTKKSKLQMIRKAVTLFRLFPHLVIVGRLKFVFPVERHV